jgi:hypothetical protein
LFSNNNTYCFFLTTEWSKAQAGTNGAITENDINSFRNGTYNVATNEIKKKWCYVMLNFLPLVSSKYTKRDVKKTMLVSEVTHQSDEALVLWFLLCNAEEWEDNVTAENDMHMDQPTMRRCKKKRGNHFSRTKLAEFLQILEHVTTARNNPITGKGWDEALKEEATRQHSPSITGPDPAENDSRDIPNENSFAQSRAHTKLIMPFSGTFSIGQPAGQHLQHLQPVVTNRATV